MSVHITPPPIKAEAFYSIGDFGFSEVYWLNDASLDASPAALNLILKARLEASCTDTNLLYARMSDTTKPRQVNVIAGSSAFWTHNAGTFVTTVVGASTTSLDPELALLLRMESASFRYAFRYFHGIPLSTYLSPAQYTNDPGWGAKLGSYNDAVTAGCMMVHGTTPPTAEVVTSQQSIRLTHRKCGKPVFLPVGRLAPR